MIFTVWFVYQTIKFPKLDYWQVQYLGNLSSNANNLSTLKTERAVAPF